MTVTLLHMTSAADLTILISVTSCAFKIVKNQCFFLSITTYWVLSISQMWNQITSHPISNITKISLKIS